MSTTDAQQLGEARIIKLMRHMLRLGKTTLTVTEPKAREIVDAMDAAIEGCSAHPRTDRHFIHSLQIPGTGELRVIVPTESHLRYQKGVTIRFIESSAGEMAFFAESNEPALTEREQEMKELHERIEAARAALPKRASKRKRSSGVRPARREGGSKPRRISNTQLMHEVATRGKKSGDWLPRGRGYRSC